MKNPDSLCPVNEQLYSINAMRKLLRDEFGVTPHWYTIRRWGSLGRRGPDGKIYFLRLWHSPWGFRTTKSAMREFLTCVIKEELCQD